MKVSPVSLSHTHLTPRTLDADFVVVGGGMAGVCAALAAARNGASVVLIQDRSMLGGNASSEIKMHIVGADCHGGRPGTRESGLIEELRLEDARRNPHRSYSQWDLLLYEKVKAESNITLLLDADCIGCTKKEGEETIRSVTVLRNSTEEVFEISGRFFADCSGDSRLGFEAGAALRMGREGRDEYKESMAPEQPDEKTLGSSILITSRRHDNPQPFLAPSWVRKFHRKQLIHRPIHSFEYGYWWFEWGGHLDTIKDNEPIRHELLRVALGIWNYVKNSGDYPESENWALDWVGAIPGKRESRRLLGPYVLTQDDVLNGHLFADSVAYGGWPIDLHPTSGLDAEGEPPCVQTDLAALYGIPFRCLRSRNISNLLFAGRNISASHVAFASTRVMATCSIMGQAIGTIAALACGEKLTLPEFDSGKALELAQQRLLKDDAFIPNVKNSDPEDKARRCAAIRASSEISGCEAKLVIDGIGRDLVGRFGACSDGRLHHWESAELPAWIEVQFNGPTEFREIHLTFDSGFQRELMLTMSDHLSARTIRGAQPELVKTYHVYGDGKLLFSVVGNYLRKRVHVFPGPVTVSNLRVEVAETNGVSAARIFEVRVY